MPTNHFNDHTICAATVPFKSRSDFRLAEPSTAGIDEVNQFAHEVNLETLRPGDGPAKHEIAMRLICMTLGFGK